MNKTYQELRALLEADKENARSVTLEINTTPELHRRLDQIAQAQGCTLDDLINDAIRRIITRAHTRENIREWLNELGNAPVTLSDDDMAWLLDPQRAREASNDNQ